MVEKGEKRQIETQKNTPKVANYNNKTLHDLVGEQGLDFRKVAPYLAEDFGVCKKDEYNKALAYGRKTNDWKQNIAYNIQIKTELIRRLKKGEPINFNKEVKPDIAKKFTPKKQDIIKNQFGIEGFSSYINGLEDGQITQLNTLSETEFRSFLAQQASESKNLSLETGTHTNALTLAQLQNYFILSEFQNKLDVFKRENDLENVTSTPEEIENALKALQPKELEVLTKSYGTPDQIKQKLKYDIDMKLLQQSDEFKKLSTEKQQEFNQMMVDYYVYNESIGLGNELKQIWGEEIYGNIARMSIAENKDSKKFTIDGIRDNIFRNQDIIQYFTTNGIQSLVKTETDKDYQYYADLMKLNPEYKKLIDADNDIKKPEKQNDQIEKIKSHAATETAEKMLLEDTNTVIKQQAVTTCLNTLKMYMDVDLTEQENVLNQFAMVDQKEFIKKNGEDVIVNINGTINGKKLCLYYNLTTGTLQQEQFLAREGGDKAFSINDPIGGKKNVEGIQLPKFQDFLTGAKNIDFKELMKTAKDSNEYKEYVVTETQRNVKKEGVWDISTEKDIFEKKVLQNVVAQDIFDMMGRDKGNLSETISREENVVAYDMYTLINNTLEYYTIDELKQFRSGIVNIVNKKGAYAQNMKEKGINQEKYLLGLLNDPKIVLDKGFQTTKNGYALFFSVFQTKEGNLPIIDLSVFEKFISKSELEVSTDQTYLDGKDMQINFKNAVAEMENTIDLADLTKDIENLPDTKKSV